MGTEKKHPELSLRTGNETSHKGGFKTLPPKENS